VNGFEPTFPINCDLSDSRSGNLNLKHVFEYGKFKAGYRLGRHKPASELFSLIIVSVKKKPEKLSPPHDLGLYANPNKSSLIILLHKQDRQLARFEFEHKILDIPILRRIIPNTSLLKNFP